MRRMLLILAAAALMVVLMATTVSPAFARQFDCPGSGVGFCHGQTGFERGTCQGYGCRD
jgi:hypothetical protein